MDLKELFRKDFVILDGAFGTQLQKSGAAYVRTPEEACLVCPEVVTRIHRSYVEAGCDIVLADTFGANALKTARYGLDAGEIINRAVSLARASGAVFVALDVGPLGRLTEPAGDLSFEEAYSYFCDIVRRGEDAGADLVFIETMSDLYEMKAALLAAKENTRLPVICSMSFDKGGRTFTGCGAAEAAISLSALGADALGANCSTGPDDMEDVVSELLKYSTVPVLLKPNAGLPDPVTGEYSLSADEFASCMRQYAARGVKLLGGCCGTTPEFISKLKSALEGLKYTSPTPERELALCSFTKTVKCSRPLIVGERINPTGKKLVKQALQSGDLDHILSVASTEADAGADLLDVNVGVPGIDEKETMVNVVKAVQGITDLPVMIDSSDPEVIGAALRVCRGKPVVNSVNGTEESMSRVLPLIKKYGAAVIALTLDGRGIPSDPEGRLEIAGRIIERAEKLGIDRKEIIVDPLTMAVSADADAANVTLASLRLIKEKCGVKTSLGISNVSFGLPDRECIIRTLLSMALGAGLDFAIIDPNAATVSSAVAAHAVLTGIDRGAASYIAKCSNAVDNHAKKEDGAHTLAFCIESWMKSEAERLTRELLKTTAPLGVIDNHLIPVLDSVGKRFEAGTLFLPQLITAADTVGVCFAAVKEKMAPDKATEAKRGRIILATVKGDIHDIGKSIVKVLLESYGYEVLDLGRDVAPETVVDAAVKNGIKLVGLSALMTTTLGAMEETVALLKVKKPDCLTMVGGAVLTADYAEKIGADFYSKDAMGAVNIAKKVFG